MVHDIRPMEVLGHNVPAGLQAVIILRMKRDAFRAADLIYMAAPLFKHASFAVPVRIADRMIARHKKLGNIEFGKDSRKWQWIGQSDAA